MHGLGYVLAAPLVRQLGGMAASGSLRLYANDDVMIGARLREYLIDPSPSPSPSPSPTTRA